MFRIGRLALLFAAASLLFAHDSAAVRQPDHLAGMPEFEAPGVKPRDAVRIAWHRPPRAMQRIWSAFQNQVGGQWMASWDRATGVPSRIIGSGISVPGSVASPGVAADAARDLLARYVDLLAPGSSIDDFAVAGNQLSGGVRTVGFYQYYRGYRVLGGQVSFRFKNDRLFVIGSEALPNVFARIGAPRVTAEQALDEATRWVKADVAGSVQPRTVEEPFVLPLVTDGGVKEYRLVVPATVDATAPISRWEVYIDAFTGQSVARAQTLKFADGTVQYNVPVRRPTDERANYPAVANLTVAGGITTSDENGLVSWTGDSAADVILGVVGPLVRVDNDGGTRISETLSIDPGGVLVWDKGDDEMADAQLNAFIHGRIVKEYSRSFAPDLEFLDQQLVANVNIDDACNAFSDGETINFFKSSSQCDNTGRLADVVYHEFGHSLHAQSIIPGAGSFDGAFSEGLSDYLAATIQEDPGMGRGFFYDNSALRHIDPANKEHIWPDDIAEIHYTGLIFAGAMWDLRKLLVEEYGHDDGVALSDRLFYAAVQRASNIPTTYVEVLAADDDNGDLTDGTPNECLINAAFGAHGLRALSAEISDLAVEPPSADGFDLSVRVLGLAEERCADDGVASAEVRYRVRGSSNDPEALTMAETDGLFTTTIPEQPEGQVVNYQVEIEFLDGSTRIFPDNPADPWYEFYVGEVEVLYCNDFEGEDPFVDGDWVHNLDSGEMRDGADDWMWGTPAGVSGSGDPGAAYSGDYAIGNDLGGDEFNGSYQPNKVNSAVSPIIETGAYSDVRLQYRRWLNVEDAYFDKGTIYANGVPAWRNLNSDQGDSSSVHHQDSEWRFHDVPLSEYIEDGTVQIKFEIDSDGGLEMGGWTIDDFCIVAAAGSVCGDGELSGTEQCDDGDANSDSLPDACRTNCRLPVCGDGVVDDGESCDDGNGIDDDECANSCDGPGPSFAGEGGGCCSTGGNAPAGSSIVLMLAVGLLLLRRRNTENA